MDVYVEIAQSLPLHSSTMDVENEQSPPSQQSPLKQ
jgi:hypothetical protein